MLRDLSKSALVLLLLCFAHAGLAQNFDYDPRRHSSLRPCDEHAYRGRIDQARKCYTALLNNSANTVVRAEAAWGAGDVRRANELFREAVRLDERNVYARSRWGRLYLTTHQFSDASTLFQQALEIDKEDRHARLGITALLARQFEGNARKLVGEILQEDDQLIEAHLQAARMDLEEGKLDSAERLLNRALSLADKQKQPPLEAYELLAALELMRGDDKADRWTQRSLNYNPRYGGVFETLAHYEVMRRRYVQAIDWLRRAVEVQPDLWSAHAELGVNLLRLGQVEEARAHLERAYSGDPFSPTTVNTLRLLDTLQTFSVERASSPDILMRLDRKEAAALRPYVEELTRASINTFSSRYGFKPTQTVQVELYPNHDDFAVRTAGLPGIGLLGVTFGYLVAMDSPSGRPSG
ncbi:MAG TPA: tetratricopeptide repeat protein, partial [Steroidobacteraceae bacterium]